MDSLTWEGECAGIAPPRPELRRAERIVRARPGVSDARNLLVVKMSVSPITVEAEWTRVASSTADPAWTIPISGFNPASERAIETILTAGNGMAGIRGSLEERSSWSHAGTF